MSSLSNGSNFKSMLAATQDNTMRQVIARRKDGSIITAEEAAKLIEKSQVDSAEWVLYYIVRNRIAFGQNSDRIGFMQINQNGYFANTFLCYIEGSYVVVYDSLPRASDTNRGKAMGKIDIKDNGFYDMNGRFLCTFEITPNVVRDGRSGCLASIVLLIGVSSALIALVGRIFS